MLQHSMRNDLADDFINEMLQRINPNNVEERKKLRGEGLYAIEKLMRDYEDHCKEQGDKAWIDDAVGVLA